MELIPRAPPAELHHISTATIRPATRTDSTKRLELTPWDLNLLPVNTIQKGLLFPKPKEDDTTWLTQLKTSLSRTLDHFYPLTGRLATETHEEDNTISVFVICNNAGAEFVHARADITVSDVLDQVYVPRIVHEFFTLNGSINYDGRSLPLLAVQVTELIDGVFIGFTMNHTIADGGTFWKFVNSWSEICRSGSHQISNPPNFNRWFHQETDLPVRFAASKIEKAITSYSLPPLKERVFHFAPQSIAKLKAKANLENTTKTPISSLQAVLAHAWRCVTRAKNYDSDQQVQYWLLMGNRARLEPPLPEEYFGNSVNRGIATTNATELVIRGFGFAAGLLNQAVSSHFHAKICNAWENWLKEPAFLCFDDLKKNTNILITGSSPRFNMYGNDFGWGCPIGVRSGCGNKSDGKMTVFPGATKGSIEIEACLAPKTLMKLGEDFEFMEFVGLANNVNV